MSKQKIRVGFIGSGGMAQAHLQGLPGFPDVEIAAFCDVVPAKAEALAAQYGAKQYAQPGDMFAAQELDCVYILLPPFAHGDAELLAENLVDELFLTISPRLFGRGVSDVRRGLVEGVDLAGKPLELSSVRRHGSHLFLRYALTSPERV